MITTEAKHQIKHKEELKSIKTGEKSRKSHMRESKHSSVPVSIERTRPAEEASHFGSNNFGIGSQGSSYKCANALCKSQEKNARSIITEDISQYPKSGVKSTESLARDQQIITEESGMEVGGRNLASGDGVRSSHAYNMFERKSCDDYQSKVSLHSGCGKRVLSNAGSAVIKELRSISSGHTPASVNPYVQDANGTSSIALLNQNRRNTQV